MSDVKRSSWESPPPSSLRLSSFYSLPVSDPCRIQLPIWASMRPVIYISGTLRPFQMGSESVSSPWLSGEAGSIILFKCSCFFREHSGSGGFLRGRNVNRSCLIRADHHAFLVRPPYINFHYRKWLFWIVTFFFFFFAKRTQCDNSRYISRWTLPIILSSLWDKARLIFMTYLSEYTLRF